MASDHHGKEWTSQPVDNEGQDHFMVVKDLPLPSREE